MSELIYSKFIEECFPKGCTPRPNQISVLNNIEKALKSDKKIILIEAPTGSGKSFLAHTISNWSRNPSESDINAARSGEIFSSSYSPHSVLFGTTTLTVTKNLQDQYVELFDDIIPLKGQSNYVCNVDDAYNVEMAPCKVPGSKMVQKCIQCNTCSYYNAFADSFIAKHNTLNYTKFFTHGEVKKRQVIVCDEAGEIEDDIVSNFTCIVPDKICKKLDIKTLKESQYSNNKHIFGWLNSLYEAFNIHYKDLRKRKTAIHILSAARKFLTSIRNIIRYWNKCEYVVEYDYSSKGIKLTPLYIGSIFQDEIVDMAEKIVLMSATFINIKSYLKTMGLNEDDVSIIHCDNSFDPAKAPIVGMGNLFLNNANLDANMGKVIDTTLKICQKHKGQKGIIHTQTLKIASALQKVTDKVSDKLIHEYLYRTGDAKNELILEEHISNPNPTILVSPSMTHGVDLKGNLANFQIVIKAPYSPLGDKRIKTLFDRDKEWYITRMLSTFVQQCGRGVRTVDDECITYVIDSVMMKAVVDNRALLPKHFLDRFI